LALFREQSSPPRPLFFLLLSHSSSVPLIDPQLKMLFTYRSRYLSFKLTSRDLVQMMAHTTILRWVQRGRAGLC
ncbi:MAG TPA: hypothetical protein VK638_35890, partial [Edaphobacter sp.]|nr:hypothetical protein [Edaphobacter sp.]